MNPTQNNLNWKGRIHKCAQAAGAAFVMPLRSSRVSLDRPVFIWGNGQSGTFILYDLLASSGAFVFPSTRGQRKKGLATQRYKAHEIVLDLKPIEGQLLCWSNVGLPFEHSGRWVFDQELTPTQAMAVDIQRVRSSYRRLCEAWIWEAHPTWRLLDKSTNYLFMLAAIDRAFPDAQHIFALRDPRLVLSSILHRFKDPDYEEKFQGFASGFYGDILLPGWQKQQNASIELRHAWQIEECIRIGLRWAGRLGERCTTVFHEDLCSDPMGVIQELMEKLDIAYPEGKLERLVTGVAPVVERHWPRSAEDCNSAAALFVDPGAIDGLTSLSRLAVELGYDGGFCGRRVAPGRLGGETK